MRESLPLSREDGHLFVTMSGGSYLLDTGAPTSFADGGTVSVLGEPVEVATEVMGLSPESLSEMVGRPTIGLLGMDILSRYDMLIDMPARELVLSTDPLELQGEALSLDEVLGVPIIELQVNNSPARVFFDTGAQVSYLQEAEALGGRPAGEVSDFYPGFGPFTTDTWHVDFALGPVLHTARCGQLPGLLALTLQMAGVDGILGNGILKGRVTGFFPRRQLMVLG